MSFDADDRHLRYDQLERDAAQQSAGQRHIMSDDLTERLRDDAAYIMAEGKPRRSRRISQAADRIDALEERWEMGRDLFIADARQVARAEVADRIVGLEAELERTRQAWVDGEDPMCDDVCVVACKGPCRVTP